MAISLEQTETGSRMNHNISSSNSSDPEKTASGSSSSPANDDNESTYSDPLSPLEHALTPDLETPAEHAAREPISYTHTRTSISSAASRPPDFEVVFEPGDPEDPKNWSVWRKGWTLFVVSWSTWVVVLNSSSFTSTIPGLMRDFNVTNQALVTLGLTTYLFGLAAGSLIVAPMSELYGRKLVYISCLLMFVLLMIPTALATSLPQFLVIRFLCALFGAATVSNGPGTVVDVTHHEYLALGMSLWSIAPLNGPVTGPIIGGFVYENLGWRWANWVVLIIGGASLLMVLTVPETYAPTILQRKTARMRKEMDDDRYWCRYDVKVSMLHLIKLNLSRPFVLAFSEPILWFFNIWISIVYSILYLCFVAYPIVFGKGGRGWGPGMTGLSFVGQGVGCMIAIAMEPVWRRIINSHKKDPVTGRPTPESTAAVMCIGAILTPIGQLVFSWTGLPATIHWAIPIAFGVPYALGNTLSFIYASNYLAGAYGIYAASALAGNAVCRSVIGGVLPLAGPKMYETLTPQWAGTLLGLLEVLLIPIPFVFYRYGDRIRARSPLIRRLREEEAENEKKAARHAARAARRRADKEKGPEREIGVVAAGGETGGAFGEDPAGLNERRFDTHEAEDGGSVEVEVNRTETRRSKDGEK